MIDGHRIYPHITVGLALSHYGKESSMLYEELAMIISAMRNRAIQPRVPEDVGKQEALFEEDNETIKSLPREFGDEKTFPILLLSFPGPQSFRYFYACMHGTRMLILQSKLYNFEKRETAPIELLIRLAMSRPLSEEQFSPGCLTTGFAQAKVDRPETCHISWSRKLTINPRTN